jgi:acetolactate synthase-1/3 small subunit
MDPIKKQTLVVLVDNEAGVLSQVSRLFSRKGYNIESLAVGATAKKNLSRITIEVMTDDAHVQLLSNQLRKLLPVHSVKILSDQNAIRRELIIVKLHTPDAGVRSELTQIANIFRASIIDVSIETLSLAVIGEEHKLEGMINILKEFEIMELVRTGVIAMERGQTTIYEETKEKGEFYYGKNVL